MGNPLATVYRPSAKQQTLFKATAYTAFALFSTALNLGTQQTVVVALANRTSAVLPASILCGTAVGFVSKYVLDKYFIFFDQSETVVDETRKVALYGAFSVLTTAIFWGSEVGAFYAFGTASAKYAGAILGLAAGYVLKFKLDQAYTFTGQRAR